MNIRKHWPLYLLLFAFLVLSTRLAWTLTFSKTGWRPHLDQWTHILSDLIGIEHRELSDQDPKQQALFWLNEVAKVESVKDDPQVALGAALMLDSPQSGFIRRHFQRKEGLDFPAIPPELRLELDREAIEKLAEDFESLCRKECLAKVETAIRLDEADVELWRARALLSFHTKAMSLDSEPRRADWLSVLDECARHDPDNALYDYLAARHLWSASADYDWEEEGYIINIEDERAFQQGEARFAAGLAKPHLKFGMQGYAATLAFLEQSSLSASDQLTVAASRNLEGRATNLLYQIKRWQIVKHSVQEREEKWDEAVATARSVLKISEQMPEAVNYPNLLTSQLVLRVSSLAILNRLRKDHPNLLNADEAKAVSARLDEAKLELKVLEEVARRLRAKAGSIIGMEKSTDKTPTFSEQLLAIALLMMASALLVMVALGLGLMSWLGARLLGKRGDEEPVRMGALRHMTAWVLGLGVSFVLLGLFPAEVISPGTQTWFVCVLIWLGFSSVILAGP